MKLDYSFQILRLTDAFYNHYPNPPFSELETKRHRNYNCLLVQSHYDFFICIPFRSHVNHRYCFHFRHSKRSKHSKSALDYSKCVIINNTNYLSTTPGIVDSDEYTEMMRNINIIALSAIQYVEDYISYLNHDANSITEKEFHRRYRFSTLPYFHDILNLPTNSETDVI